jgi:hypothetical protein
VVPHTFKTTPSFVCFLKRQTQLLELILNSQWYIYDVAILHHVPGYGMFTYVHESLMAGTTVALDTRKEVGTTVIVGVASHTPILLHVRDH